MKNIGLLSLAAVAGLFAGSALAAQNVANTSQKGSLLIWPLITVDHQDGRSESTVIEISNDANYGVHVECVYVNERKGRVDFDFDLTAKQVASWDVYSLEGDQVHPPRFPTNAGVPVYPYGSFYKGELICWATNAGRQFQIAWNHLTGTATVTGMYEPDNAFRYNAWAFTARNDIGDPARDAADVSHGKPGLLKLTGGGAGTYDACPFYNIANFMPNGAKLGALTTVRNDFAFSSCRQDLRERYNLWTTKLDFTVWNSFEDSFTGAHWCADSLGSVQLSDHEVTQGSNFDYEVLGTPNARFQVRGVRASPPCPGNTKESAILGVLASNVNVYVPVISDSIDGSESVGNTVHGAGVALGFVRWDPESIVPHRPN